MNEKEIAEIRRRFNPDKSNIRHICGCYVNEKYEIVSRFNHSLALMPKEEAEKLLAILKRTLSGTLEKNLIDIAFDTKQVVDSEEHRLLMALKNSELKDEKAVQSLFQCVAQTLTLEGNYMILLAYDTYDVPYRSTDGQRQDDASSEVFSYILCSVCPIKTTKPALSYHLYDNAFHTCQENWIVAAPELGFMFPTFDDRSSNIYNALYYTRDMKENHKEFVDVVFRTDLPMPALEQKETFQSILEHTLADDCSYDVVQTVHAQLCDMIVQHKTNKETEPLVVTKNTVKGVLESCGVPESRMTAFDRKYDGEFGADTNLSPRNIVDTKQFQVRTPDVTIRVNPERSNLVETRIIDGAKYILIRVDEGVEVNGVNIHISE